MKKLYTILILCLGIQSIIAQTSLTTAVDFTVTDVHGDTHNLFTYLDDGKHVIVDFFFTTCGPCISSVPTLNQAYTDYGCNTGEVIFLSVDMGNSDVEVLQYENDYGGLLPAASGNDGGGNAVISSYGISAYPTVVLIAPNRVILEQDIYPVSNITTALPNAGLNMTACGVTPSWDCIISPGNCQDPGTGAGTYSTLAACQAACVVVTPTWDCMNGACIDPGNGSGMYASQALCTAACGVSAIEEHTKNKEYNKFTDVLGREWTCSFANLPKGLYIINNRKVLKSE